MSRSRIGDFQVIVRDRRLGSHKFNVAIQHVPSKRVVWRARTVYGGTAFHTELMAERVLRILDERKLSAQAAMADSLDSFKSFIEGVWVEVRS